MFQETSFFMRSLRSETIATTILKIGLLMIIPIILQKYDASKINATGY